MVLGGIRSLWDIRGLEHIRKVCSTHGVHFTAYGGLLRHLLLKLLETAQSGDRWDLFDLVPFASDIDLIHTGTPDQTELLLRTIVYDIPFADCFRWQLRSVHDNAIYWDSMKVNNVIPASLMTLSTNSTDGIYDRWDGYRDYSSRKFRYIRNGFYTESPLYRAGRDLEACSALLYYRVLLEAGVGPGELESQPGLADARAVVLEAARSADIRIRLEDSAYLRARMRYLCAALGASARPNDLRAAAETLALGELAENLGGDLGLSSILLPGAALAVSAHLGGDTFRIPFHTDDWFSGEEAAARFERALDDLPQRPVPSDSQPDARVFERPRLGPGQQILFGSPPFDIYLGRSESSHAGPEWLHEFVHFGLRLPVETYSEIKGYLPDGLAILAVFRSTYRPEGSGETGNSEGGGVGGEDNEIRSAFIVPLPSVFGLNRPLSESNPGTLLIRINCAGLFEAVPALENRMGGYVEIEFFVVSWKGGIR